MADDLTEDNKRRLEAGREAKAQSLEEFAKRTKGRPTPTQDENDRAALGEHITEHEADGGEPDPGGQVEAMTHRSMEAGRGGSYQTRQARPATQPPQHRPPGSSSS
jgi:hypothetical protein